MVTLMAGFGILMSLHSHRKLIGSLDMGARPSTSLFLIAIALALGFSRPAAAIDVRRPEVKEFIGHMADTSPYTKRQCCAKS